ncbi:MAG: PAS domain-containing protein [Pseudomonadota bacterium]
MHRLLERQLKRTLGLDPSRWPEFAHALQSWAAQDTDIELARVLGNLPAMLERVSEAYDQHDRDMALLRRSLELSSEELIGANQKLRQEAEASAQAVIALRQALDSLQTNASDPTGDLVAMAHQMVALTREQERMRQALTTSEQRFELAMQGANDGLWDYDLSTNTVYYSPRWKSMIGEPDHAVGNSPEEWKSRLHPEDMHKTMQAIQAHLAGDTALYQVEFRFRHHQGHYLWILSRGIAVRDATGRAIRLVGTHSDITQRVELEHYLAQFKAALDEHAIVSITDVRGTITYANRKFCEISGYSRQEVLGQTHRLVRSEVHTDAFYQDIWQTISSGHTWTGEICNRSKDGSHYWVLATIAPMLDENGLPYQYIGIRADITRSKLHEQELRQAKEDAEAASRTKSEFLANMSHEIRTPMNGVLGMLNLALDTPLNDEQKEFLTLAHSSAHALLAILNDILDFSKIEAGRLDVHPEALDPGELLQEMARLNAPRCLEKGLALHLDIDPDLPPRVLADPVRLRQVLINLISNALKFTPQGSITLEARQEAGRVRFAVIDTGIGIPPEKQAAVFEAFTQADGSITKRFGGTGLGLTISNHLVKLMGGSLGLQSTPNQGSSFFFSLPGVRATENPQPARPHLETSSPGRSLRILLAEDNPINQKLTCALLERAGHQITVAADGHAAMAALTDGSFDLVLMDMQMPGMDGLETTRHIRALAPPAGQVPIVALTANAFPEDQARCLAAGMNGYVAKPIRRDSLFTAIRDATTGALS